MITGIFGGSGFVAPCIGVVHRTPDRSRSEVRCTHGGQPSEAFRVIYVAKFADAVHVLHCFQKKTAKTGKADLDVAAKRYRDLLKEPGQ